MSSFRKHGVAHVHCSLAGRIMGLNTGDWLILIAGIAVAGLLMLLAS